MKKGIVMMVQIWVANTPAEARCGSPPNLVVNIGVVEADGIADCKTIIARVKGGRKPNKPVIKNASVGIIINLHNTINARGFLYVCNLCISPFDIIEPTTRSAKGIVAEPIILVESRIKWGNLSAARPAIIPHKSPIVPLFMRFLKNDKIFALLRDTFSLLHFKVQTPKVQ